MQTLLLTTLRAICESVAASCRRRRSSPARSPAALVVIGLMVGALGDAAHAQVFTPETLLDAEAAGLAAVYAEAGGEAYVAVVAASGPSGAEEVAFDGCAAATAGGEPESRFLFDAQGRLRASVFNHAGTRVDYQPAAPHLVEGRFQVIARLGPIAGGPASRSRAAIFEIERRDLGVVTFLRVNDATSGAAPTIVTVENGAIVTVLGTSASGGPMAVMQRLRGPAPLADVCG